MPRLAPLVSGKPISLAEAREDTVMVTFSFKNGAIGSWSWSLAAPGNPSANLRFHCSEGSIEDNGDNPYRVFHLFERRGMEPDRIEQGLVAKSDGTEMSLLELEKTHVASLSADQKEFLFPKGMWDGFTYEIHEFFECLRGNRAKPEVDGWEGLKSLAVCEAVYESAFCGEPVSVDDVAAGKIRAYQAEIDKHWNLL